MITLRKNQTEPIEKAIEYFRSEKSKPSLIVLPTAWGKSILTAFVAKEVGDKLLIIQPSKELLEQNYSKYFSLCGLEAQAEIFSASLGRKNIGKITYATIGSIYKLGATFKEYGFTKILIDEADRYPRESDGMLRSFIDTAGIKHVLGITATPIKLQTGADRAGNRFSKLVMLTSRSKKGNFFKEILHVGQIQEMVEMGFWSKLQYQISDFDSSQLQFNTAKSEFTEESVQRAYYANDIHTSIINALNDNQDRRSVLVYMPSVQDAIDFSEKYPNSAAVWGTMDKKERQRVIDEYKVGRIRVLFNVRVLAVGFDAPQTDCIILGISTASLALYYQIIGRATRIHDEKDNALIIDLGGNTERFGRVEDLHFEKGAMWRLFGTGGRLLSGIPIHEIGKFTKEDVIKLEQDAKQPVEIMPFGKYKDQPLTDIPTHYLKWMLENFNWDSKNAKLRNSIMCVIG